jgi:hypothetical protein
MTPRMPEYNERQPEAASGRPTNEQNAESADDGARQNQESTPEMVRDDGEEDLRAYLQSRPVA